MTKEEMLRLLTAAYTGPGSAAEGTFAGDVLRSCADGMAQLWSMEIDGLERRAFVSSAVGEWLTAVCADRGCVRKEGETDEELRARTLAALAATPASGNADHYAAWCGQAADILRVKVLPLARGNGTVDIVAVGREGKPRRSRYPGGPGRRGPGAARGRGREVIAAAETAVNVAASVTLMDGGSLEGVKTAFSQGLTAFFRDNALRTRVVSHGKALRLLLDCAGVADVSGFTMNGSGDSLTLTEGAVPVVGTLALTEVKA